MKRDMELVRRILLEVEAKQTADFAPLHLNGVEDDVTDEHLRLLEQAGYLEVVKTSGYILPKSLSWKGHEFLASIKDDRVWTKVQDTVVAQGGSLPLEVVKELATAVLRSMLGLGG